MPDIAIITDTASDLRTELREQYSIQAVPLVVRFGNDEYLECDLPLDDFWTRTQQAPPYPGTSQPSVGMFEEAFAQHVEQGKEVICVTVTGKHSGTFNSAYAASQKFPGKVTVFDTLSLSLAEGYFAIAAARAAADGRSVEEIIELLRDMQARTHFFFALDTIEYLRRGGRADSVMPLLDRIVRVLNIKPVLNVVDGQITPMAAARSHAGAARRLVDEIAKYGPGEMLIALHSQLPDEASNLAQALAERLDFPRERMMVGEIGPVLSCHAGPRVIGAAIVQSKV